MPKRIEYLMKHGLTNVYANIKYHEVCNSMWCENCKYNYEKFGDADCYFCYLMEENTEEYFDKEFGHDQN